MTFISGDLVTLDAESNLADYLEFSGWQRSSEGSFGVLWAIPGAGSEVAVPRGIRPGTGMWDGTVGIIAERERSTRDAVDRSIRRFWMDVSDFRATSSIVRGNYIAAEAGSALFSGAWKILRSSATTARGAKVAIGGNYSAAGDRSIEGAMFAQTEPGSYVLPMLVPIDRSLAEAAQRDADREDLLLPLDDFFQTNAQETEQRRATRTMAQAISAVYETIIKPGVEPTKRAIDEAVVAGASRELVRALHEIVSEESVSSFDVTFSWAPKAGAVPKAPSRVEVPKDAAVLLSRAAKQMVPSKEPITTALNGPIHALYHPKGQTFGEATIEAAYKGRVRRVVVGLRGAEVLDNAHKWFRAHETLLVSGTVRSTPEGLKIDSPTNMRPLGVRQLFDEK
jgi:hypothetical protein